MAENAECKLSIIKRETEEGCLYFFVFDTEDGFATFLSRLQQTAYALEGFERGSGALVQTLLTVFMARIGEYPVDGKMCKATYMKEEECPTYFIQYINDTSFLNQANKALFTELKAARKRCMEYEVLIQELQTRVDYYKELAEQNGDDSGTSASKFYS